MKIAIIALTKQGKKTALKLKQHLPEETDLYLHEHSKPREPAFSFKILRELMPKLWPAYPVLIFIMAAGIVTRQVARFLESKAEDPAVLVLDDNGRFVIPLLSGHLGGANAWSRYLADLLQATPIITTATDGANLIAPDEYARRLNWTVWPLANLAGINRLLLEQGYLTVWTEYPLDEKHPLKSDLKYMFLCENEREKADLIISAFPKAPETKIYLIPRSLGAGIGCRRGIDPETVLRAIFQALEQVGAAREALGGIYSIDLKADEPGLAQAAEALGIPFEYFSPECLQEINDQRNLTKSEFVKNKIGVDGVCEAASILGTQMGELILPKLKPAGEGITIALSRRKSLSWESDPEIPFI